MPSSKQKHCSEPGWSICKSMVIFCIFLFKTCKFCFTTLRRRYINPRQCTSRCIWQGGLAQTFFMTPKKINTKQNRTQKIKSIKITNPKNKSFFMAPANTPAVDDQNFQSNTVTGVQPSLLKILFVYDAQISQNGIIPDLFALTLVTFRHNSIVKVLWNFSAAI